jgi:hypothetical protein
MKAKLAGIAAVGLVLAAVPVVAHHSFTAEYDASKPVTLKGLVSRIEWMNPHARLHLDVEDDKGQITDWKLELASPKVLVMQCGWKTTSVKVGDVVTVEGAMAKDGSASANARIVTTADGRRLSAGSSGGDAPPR